MEVPVMTQFLINFRKQLIDDGKPDLEEISRKLMELSSKEDDLENLLVELSFMTKIDEITSVRILLDLIKQKNRDNRRDNKKGKKELPRDSLDMIKTDINAWKKKCTNLKNETLTYIQNVSRAYNRERALAVYSPLLELSKQNPMIFFTTNYDPILEWTCEELNYNYADNFVKGGRERLFFDEHFNQFGMKNIDIIKLHGSVTWYEDKHLNKIEKIRHRVESSEEGHPIQNLMIMPAEFKHIYSYPFFKLYLEFLGRIKNADMCIVIGHSLRDEYIKGALEDRLDDHEFTLVVISSSLLEDMGDGIKQMLSRKNVIYCPFKFELFSKELAQILTNYLTDKMASIEKLKTRAQEQEKRIHETVKEIKFKINKNTLKRGEKVEMDVSFKGNLRNGYYNICINSQLDNKQQIEFNLPGTYDVNKKIGTLMGYNKISKRYKIPISEQIPPGKYDIYFNVFESPEDPVNPNPSLIKSIKRTRTII